MGLSKKKRNKRCIPKEGMPHASACQKKKERIKEAYPKKVCHMLRHVKKKEEIAPIQKKEREMVHTKEFIHHPPKISTHLDILIKVYDLFLLWIRSLTQQNKRSKYAFKSCIPTAPAKTTIRDRVRKKGSIKKSLGKELYTSSDPRDHLRNFIKFF